MLHRIIEQLVATCFILLLVSAVMLSFPGGLLSKLGWHLFTVETGSMTPALSVGSAILVQRTEELQPGDVITFRKKLGSTNYVTHRIAEVTDGAYVTQGDANLHTDTDTVSHYAVVGKVLFAIPLLGKFLLFVLTPIGLVSCIIIPASLILLYEYRRHRKRKKRHEAITVDYGPNIRFPLMTILGIMCVVIFVSVVFLLAINTASSASFFTEPTDIVWDTIDIIKIGAGDLISTQEPISPLAEDDKTLRLAQ